MSFLAALNDEKLKATKGPACVFVSVLAAMSDSEAADLRTALADQAGVPGTYIARALEAIGHSVSATTVQRHRKGECNCPRSA